MTYNANVLLVEREEGDVPMEPLCSCMVVLVLVHTTLIFCSLWFEQNSCSWLSVHKQVTSKPHHNMNYFDQGHHLSLVGETLSHVIEQLIVDHNTKVI